MAFQLAARALRSRAIRETIVGENPRRITVNSLSQQGGEEKGILETIIDYGKKFLSFSWSSVISGIKAIKFSFSAIWRGVTTAIKAIWEFNWRITDEEINSKIQANLLSLAGASGGFLGRVVGWVACGALPGAAIFAFNESLGLYVLEKVGEEALEDLASEAAGLIRTTVRALAQNFLWWSYKNARALMLSPNNPIINTFTKHGVLDQGTVDNFRKEASKPEPWSFALEFEKRVNSIENPFLQEFTEEFFDELFDACVEAGYVVAGGIDEFLVNNEMTFERLRGRERRVEIII